MNPQLIDFGAPWPFTVVGGGVVALYALALLGKGGPAVIATMQAPPDPQLRNLNKMASAVSLAAISAYTVSFLAWGMKGYLALLAFLLHFEAWAWPVAVTVALWAIFTTWAVGTLSTHWRKPPGDRRAIAYIIPTLTFLIFGGLWAWGAFVPVPAYASYPLSWEAAVTVNFLLHVIFIGSTAESLAYMLLPLLPPSSGTAHHEMTVRVTDRNATMIPARGRKQ